MIKYIFSVEGMMCCNCEKHAVDEVKKVSPKAKAVASHVEKTVTVTAKDEIDVKSIENALTERGYKAVLSSKEEVVKKGLFK